MHPLLNYTYSLGEKLGKSKAEILQLGADEFFDWMAYDMLKDDKFRQRIEWQRSKEMDDDERSKAIKQMFEDIRG